MKNIVLFIFFCFLIVARATAQKDTIIKKAEFKIQKKGIVGKPGLVLSANKVIVGKPAVIIAPQMKVISGKPAQALSTEQFVVEKPAQILSSQPVSANIPPVLIFCSVDIPVQLTYDDDENVRRILTTWKNKFPKNELERRIKSTLLFIPDRYKTRKVTDEKIRQMIAESVTL